MAGSYRDLTLEMATGHLAKEAENQTFWVTGTGTTPQCCDPEGCGSQLL